MIENCRDFRRVKRLCDWDLNISSKVFYLIEVDGGVDVGVWWLHPYENGLMAHASMGAACRGKKAVASALNAFEWIFENTGSEAVFVAVPAGLRHVCLFVRQLGMEYRGVNEDNHRCYRMPRPDRTLNKRKAA